MIDLMSEGMNQWSYTFDGPVRPTASLAQSPILGLSHQSRRKGLKICTRSQGEKALCITDTLTRMSKNARVTRNPDEKGHEN